MYRKEWILLIRGVHRWVLRERGLSLLVRGMEDLESRCEEGEDRIRRGDVKGSSEEMLERRGK